MPQVNTGTAYVDQALSDVSIRYSNDMYIATDIFPILEVPKETGVLFKFDKENLRAPQTTLRGDYARSERFDYGLSTVPYGPLLEHSAEIPVSQRLLDQYAAPLQPTVNATETATEKIWIEKELALATYLSTSANLVAGNFVTLAGATQWNTSTSTPFNDIQAGATAVLQKSTKKPNVLVLGRQVYDGLINNSALVTRLQYVARATNQEMGNALADLFGVKKVLVGEGIANTAKEGQVDATSFIWGKNAYLLYVTESPAVESVSAGYHVTLKDKRFVDTWYEQPIKTQFVRANDFYSRFVMAAECIYGFYNAVA